MNPAHREERRVFNEAMRARIRLLAAERNLPHSEIKWMGRLTTRDVVSFMTRRNISADWLLCGDLKGLLRTIRARKSIASWQSSYSGRLASRRAARFAPA
jgi:hypothetical protein